MRIFTRGMQQGKESARDIAVHEDGRGKVPLRVREALLKRGNLWRIFSQEACRVFVLKMIAVKESSSFDACF